MTADVASTQTQNRISRFKVERPIMQRQGIEIMIENRQESLMESKEIQQIKKAVNDKTEGWQKLAIEFYLRNVKPVELTTDQVLEY